MSAMQWMAGQLQSEAFRAKPRPTRFNPKPAGVNLPGGAAEAVLLVLQMRPRAWFTHAQIVFLSGRTTKAVGFALRYLQLTGRIRATEDAMRNPRYLRYSAQRDEQ